MKSPAVDFEGVFESLAEAIAICDEHGAVLTMNRAAREYLRVGEGADVSIELQARETVRQIRLIDVVSAEFFLADVGVFGAGRDRVSASFHPLPDGSYRVLFAVDAGGRTTSLNVRMLESLVNVGRHVEMFKSADKTLALFAASFAEIFPDYSFRLMLGDGVAVHEHPGWEGAAADGVPGDDGEFLFHGSQRQWSTALAEHGHFTVERADDAKFKVAEREAFETFSQQLGLTLSRWKSETSSNESMLVGPIIDQIDAIVVVCDARRRILVSNRTFESMIASGDAPGEVVGRDLLEFFGAAEQPAARLAAAGVMANGAPTTIDAHLKTARGAIALRVQFAPAHGRDGVESGFVVTGQRGDLSIRELEAQMSRAEQLMNIGELATGVAHELKNPLTSIMNYAEYLLAKYQPGETPATFDHRDAARLQRIISGVAQIDEFVNDLVTLARPHGELAAPVNVHAVIHESVALCDVTLQKAQARVKLRLAAEQAVVYGVGNQLKQVFVNLVANAGKAMAAGGGTVAVSTRLENDRVVCLVADDGVGMSADTLARVFEPFFTTRQSRGGSGLGLALVRSIIDRHGGEIAVRSELGVGTTFTIALPVLGGVRP